MGIYKQFLDWSGFTTPGSAIDLRLNGIRKALEYDTYGNQTVFKAIALTDAWPLNAAAADQITGGGLLAGAAVTDFIFKGRILGDNSPHGFLPDPCDPTQAGDSARAMSLVKMHTSFVSTADSELEDNSMVKQGDIIWVELKHNVFSYDLQYGKFIKKSRSAALISSEDSEEESCDHLRGLPWEEGGFPVGGARSITAYEERYSYACRASSPYDAQIRATAARLEIEPAVICAFRAVESGNLPATALRFEPHVFLRNRPDLAAQIPYTRADSPGGCPESRKGACVGKVSYQPTETGRAAFEHAFSLDAGIAVKSSSFGLFQIIGFNFPADSAPAIANYRTDPQGFMNHMNADPVRFSFEILEAWFRARPRALEAAKTHDWLTLAKAYNGVLAAQQDYQLKLEAAYNVAVTDCYGTAVAAAD